MTLKSSGEWWVLSEGRDRVVALSTLGYGAFEAESVEDLPDFSERLSTRPSINRDKNLHIAVGAGCPEKCSYCYHRGSAKGATSVSFERMADVVRQIRLCAKIRNVTYGGNEPLVLWETLEKSIEAMSDASEDRILLTNGLRLDEPKVQYLKEKRLEVGLSLNHLLERHLLDEVLLQIKRFNVKSNIAITLCRKNLDDITNKTILAMNTINNYGFNALSVNLDFVSTVSFGKADVSALVQSVKKLIVVGRHYSVFVGGDWDKIMGPICNGIPSTFCQAAYETYYVTSSNVSTCPLLDEKIRISPAEVTSQDAGSLEKPFVQTEILRQRVVREWCQGCPLLLYCNGGCLGTVHKEAWCDFMTKLVSFILTNENLRSLYLQNEQQGCEVCQDDHGRTPDRTETFNNLHQLLYLTR